VPSIQLLPDLQEQQNVDFEPSGNPEWLVIVYNNDHNTYDEVIEILIRATGCTLEEAEMETWEVDHLGRSIVHHGSEEECDRAASVIRTIGIHVEVREQ
jgi:ATP-dependent Clp protease adaptor protein ClpS